MRGKAGSAHFEMIIGFVFFVGFVLFLFMFLSPWSNSPLPSSALGELYDVFIENVNVSLSSVFVKAENDADCFLIDLPEELFDFSISGQDSRVTRLGGIGLESALSDGNLNVKSSGENFFRVALSPEFEDDVLPECDVLEDFELGGVVELEVVSYSALVDMRDRYYSDYSGLKAELGVSDIFDFAIVPEGMEEAAMEPIDGVPSNADVLARDYVVKVLNRDGDVSNERISFRIW